MIDTNILCITACLKRASVACRYYDTTHEINVDPIDVSSSLPLLVSNFCKNNSIDMHQLSNIVTPSGPGSFTGIRVAHSLTKAIALVTGSHAGSISYFDVISHMYKFQNCSVNACDTCFIEVIKSEKSQIYYRCGENFQQKSLCSDLNNSGVCDLQGVANIIFACQDNCKNKVVLIGESAEEISNALPSCYGTIHSQNISDFRLAINVLNAYIANTTGIETPISPLYINARAQTL